MISNIQISQITSKITVFFLLLNLCFCTFKNTDLVLSDLDQGEYDSQHDMIGFPGNMFAHSKFNRGQSKIELWFTIDDKIVSNIHEITFINSDTQEFIQTYSTCMINTDSLMLIVTKTSALSSGSATLAYIFKYQYGRVVKSDEFVPFNNESNEDTTNLFQKSTCLQLNQSQVIILMGTVRSQEHINKATILFKQYDLNTRQTSQFQELESFDDIKDKEYMSPGSLSKISDEQAIIIYKRVLYGSEAPGNTEIIAQKLNLNGELEGEKKIIHQIDHSESSPSNYQYSASLSDDGNIIAIVSSILKHYGQEDKVYNFGTKIIKMDIADLEIIKELELPEEFNANMINIPVSNQLYLVSKQRQYKPLEKDGDGKYIADFMYLDWDFYGQVIDQDKLTIIESKELLTEGIWGDISISYNESSTDGFLGVQFGKRRGDNSKQLSLKKFFIHSARFWCPPGCEACDSGVCQTCFYTREMQEDKSCVCKDSFKETDNDQCEPIVKPGQFALISVQGEAIYDFCENKCGSCEQKADNCTQCSQTDIRDFSKDCQCVEGFMEGDDGLCKRIPCTNDEFANINEECMPCLRVDGDDKCYEGQCPMGYDLDYENSKCIDNSSSQILFMIIFLVFAFLLIGLIAFYLLKNNKKQKKPLSEENQQKKKSLDDSSPKQKEKKDNQGKDEENQRRNSQMQVENLDDMEYSKNNNNNYQQNNQSQINDIEVSNINLIQ